MKLSILVTGGLGYIGSLTVVELINVGHKVFILDNLSNSNEEVVTRIKKITGTNPDLCIGDIRDRELLRKLFKEHQFEAVMHFAGLKAVGESEQKPLIYYDNNVSGSISLFDECLRAGVGNIIFSSSATVYGASEAVKYVEDMPLKPVNVYGRTKLMVEDVLRDIKKSNPAIGIAILRYFNPVGAHSSGLLGESPNGIPNNLMPYIADVASGIRDKLYVYGKDYPTPDGTGLRDYIHVQDLAIGHIAALEHISSQKNLITLNLGTGKPYSVMDMVKAFSNVSGKNITCEFVNRRAGDLAEYYAEPLLANELIQWSARLGIDKMCEDTWRWQMNKK